MKLVSRENIKWQIQFSKQILVLSKVKHLPYMRIITLLLLLTPLFGLSQNKLSIEVLGVPNSDGNINVALYNTSDGFLKSEQAVMGKSVRAKEGKTSLYIEDVPDGEFAIALYHDENGNNELDTNFFGIPKETVGFSNAKMKTFGPPKFAECAFKMEKHTEVKVAL